MWKVSLQELLLCSFYIFVFSKQNFTDAKLDSSVQAPGNGSNNSTTHALDPQERMVTYCRTPNNDPGYCMPIQKCSKLLNQLNNSNAKTFLLESQCGAKNENRKNPFVCCGKYSNYKDSLFPKQCGYQNVTIRGRILGGKKAEIGEFPWLARLYNKHTSENFKQFGCTGFLISEKFVLTAAHCIKSNNTYNFGPLHEVVLGEHNTKTKIDCKTKNTNCAPKVQTIKIKKALVHPLYNSSSLHHHNDIGLIQLRKAANITKFVFPICLIKQQKYDPFEYWLSGWGTTETEESSHIKLKVSIPPFAHKNCTKQYKNINVPVVKSQLCAGGKKNRDSCQGDSGGPLMLVENGNHWFAAGVVSFGLGCGRKGWPGIYTNITSYYNWIEQSMVKLAKPKAKVVARNNKL